MLIDINWNQNVQGYRTTCQPATCGAKPSDIKGEIDAGRPVIAVVTKLLHNASPEYWYDPSIASVYHAFPVFGYKEDPNEITEYGPRLKLLCYDTWHEDSWTGTSYRIIDFPTPTEAHCQFASGATVSLIHYSACTDDGKWWRLMGFTFLHINDNSRCPLSLGTSDSPSGTYSSNVSISLHLPSNSRVHFTADGRDPNPKSPYVPLDSSGDGTLRIYTDCSLKLRTYRDATDSWNGYLASAVTQRDYTISSPGADLKAGSNGNGVIAGPLVVTAGTGPLGSDICYVEEQDRLCGIRVQTSNTVTTGDLVTVSGTLGTDSDGERVIASATVQSLGATTPTQPYGVVNGAVGGAAFNYNSTTWAGQQGITGRKGLNNIGLLVKTTGLVSNSDDEAKTFDIDDGSPLGPVKVAVPSAVTVPADGHSVTVTGVSSCEKPSNDVLPVVRCRCVDDIIDYGECQTCGSSMQSPVMSPPEEPEVPATGTVAWALDQSDNTTVTVKACSVTSCSSSGLAITDGWGTFPSILVPGNWAVDEWSTVDVTGVLTTLPDGTRAITATQVLVYTDSNGRPFTFPMPWRNGRTSRRQAGCCCNRSSRSGRGIISGPLFGRNASGYDEPTIRPESQKLPCTMPPTTGTPSTTSGQATTSNDPPYVVTSRW